MVICSEVNAKISEIQDLNNYRDLKQ